MSPLQQAVLKARYARRPEPVPEPMKIEIADPQAERIKRLEEVVRRAAIEHPLPRPRPIMKCPPACEIIQAVAEHFRIPVLEIVSQRRTKDIVRPRQVAMFLCKKLTLLSYPGISREFGRSDHTTSLHAFRRVTALRATDTILNASIVEIEQTIAAKYPGVAT